MARENPLLTMGVPRAVIVREKAFGSTGGILAVAEANFKSFVKRYSADLPGGDAELMIVFSAAMEELRDPDALEFYIDELIDATEVQDLYARKQAQQIVSRDTRALTRVAANLAFVDQFAVLGIKEPTSYLVDFQGQRLVVDVLSPSQARVRMTDIPPEIPIGANSNAVAYDNGVWREAYVDGDYREHWVTFAEFVTDETVTVVGFGPQHFSKSADALGIPPVRVMLDVPVSRLRLSWQEPEHSWFLSELHHDRSVKFPRLIFFKQGLLTVTDQLIETARFVEAS